MEAKQRLFYALGQLAYAVARADGKVQAEEEKKLHEIISAAAKKEDIDYDFAETIFQILDRDHVDSIRSYEWAMNEIRACSEFLSHPLKEKFLRIIEAVGQAYPPITEEEKKLIQNASKDLKRIWFHSPKLYRR